MILKLKHAEFILLREGMTMYKYVNFRGTLKPELENELLDQFNALDQKLFAMVRPDRNAPTDEQDQLELGQSELHMLVRIIEADINACGEGDTKNSRTNFRVNFGQEKKVLDRLLATLRAFGDPA